MMKRTVTMLAAVAVTAAIAFIVLPDRRRRNRSMGEPSPPTAPEEAGDGHRTVHTGSRHRAAKPKVPGGGPSRPTRSRNDEPEPISGLPQDLGEKVERIWIQCRHARDELDMLTPSSSPWITKRDADELVRIEEELRRTHNRFASYGSDLLRARLEANPAHGFSMPLEEFNSTDIGDLLRERYPGWPDGYQNYRRQTNGMVLFGAWKVEDDPELEAFTREQSLMMGSQALAIRASYIRYFQFP